MRTFLICLLIAVFCAGLSLTAVPVTAQVGFPPTLTPFPTFNGNYNSPAEATLARNMTNTIWWENAPYNNIPAPRPGFVMYVIQWWNWLNDTTHQIIMTTILLLVVIMIVLRFAHRVRGWGEKSDGANVGSTEIVIQPERRR